MVTYFALCCVSDVTATTKSYTYGHALSRHDALPISVASSILRCASPLHNVSVRHDRRRRPQRGSSLGVTSSISVRSASASMATRLLGTPMRSKRSEEHTSELKSLMRISYAGFCLKKTKKKRIQNRSRKKRAHY